MTRILRAILTRDNALHVALGAAGAGLATVLYMIPAPWHLPAIAAVGLYLREVTQMQTRLYGGDFRRGWTLDLEHHMEWAAPAAVLFALTGAWAAV